MPRSAHVPRRDHFRILGLSRDATAADVRVAYRRRVRETHPDARPGAPVQGFLEVREAWEVLRDPARRRAHRQELERATPHTPPPPRPATATAWEAQPRAAGTAEAEPLEVRLDPSAATHGGRFATRVRVRAACPACGGQPMVRLGCDVCAGAGRLTVTVRAWVRVPPFLRDGEEALLACTRELFGATTLQARIRYR